MRINKKKGRGLQASTNHPSVPSAVIRAPKSVARRKRGRQLYTESDIPMVIQPQTLWQQEPLWQELPLREPLKSELLYLRAYYRDLFFLLVVPVPK